jgi:hypothetical protein
MDRSVLSRRDVVNALFFPFAIRQNYVMQGQAGFPGRAVRIECHGQIRW